jgi:hypothetical protein
MSKRKGDPGYAPGWCIHYVGSPKFYESNKRHVCEAGVDMESFRGVKFDARPCFLDDGESRPEAIECKHLRRPTKEEIGAHEEWVRSRLDRLRVVMKAIESWRNANKGRSHSEVVECPICKGRLHLSISSYNSHVHGKCETPGCVSWME